MVISAINSAMNSISNASARVNVAANNIANVSSTYTRTDNTVTKTPYIPQDIITITGKNGEVNTKISDSSLPPVSLYDSKGITQQPNIDPTQELSDIENARSELNASLKIIEQQRDLQKGFLDIFA